uniref:(northern house mosquito) hypothetical protein n=1 Tax=Culex pipiens TaxID=7175 RepID=A0A8D8HVU6_CULPI
MTPFQFINTMHCCYSLNINQKCIRKLKNFIKLLTPLLRNRDAVRSAYVFSHSYLALYLFTYASTQRTYTNLCFSMEAFHSLTNTDSMFCDYSVNLRKRVLFYERTYTITSDTSEKESFSTFRN